MPGPNLKFISTLKTIYTVVLDDIFTVDIQIMYNMYSADGLVTLQ